VFKTEGMETRVGIVGHGPRSGQVWIERRERMRQAPQQQKMHGAQEEIGYWLVLSRLGGDSQHFSVMSDTEGEPSIQRRNVAFALGKARKALGKRRE
jgi:hypothetical protein